MAQQITSNNSSIIDMMTSTNNNYVDTSSPISFDNIFNNSMQTSKQSNQISDKPSTLSSDNTQNIELSEIEQNAVNTSAIDKTNETKDLTQILMTIQSQDLTQSLDNIQMEDLDITQIDDSFVSTNTVDETFTEILDSDTDSIIDDNDIDYKNEEIVDFDILDTTDKTQTTEDLDITTLVNLTNVDYSNNQTQNNIEIDTTKNDVSTNEVTVKIADTSTVANSNIEQPKTDKAIDQNTQDIDTESTNKNLITQDLIDDLNVEIVESVDNNTIKVCENKTEIFTDSKELLVRDNIEEYTKEASAKLETRTDKTIDFQTVKDSVKQDVKTDDTDIEINENEEVIDSTEETKIAQDDINEENNNTENHSATKEDSLKHDKKDDIREKMLTFASEEETVEYTNTNTEAENATATNSVNTVNTQHHTTDINTQTITTKTGQTVPKENIMSQIHDKLQSMNRISNSKLTMVLNPESLGKVSVQLTNTNNGLIAEMIVDSAEVKELLDSNLTNLKETLTGQGINIDNVTIKVAESENNAEMDYTEQESSEQNHQQQNKNANKENQNKFAKIFSKTRDNDETKEMGEE